MSLVTDLRNALTADLAKLTDLIEGITDLINVVQKEGRSETLTVLNDTLSKHTARKTGVTTLLNALVSLIEAGYPAEIPIVVEQTVRDVVAEQLRTQSLVYDKMTVPRDAATATVAIGDPIPNQ